LKGKYATKPSFNFWEITVVSNGLFHTLFSQKVKLRKIEQNITI
jgi:hypothetical protein